MLLVSFSGSGLFSRHPVPDAPAVSPVTLPVAPVSAKPVRRKGSLRLLAGPYAHWIRSAARNAGIPPALLAAVAYEENGGNFQGAAHRVSGAGAIGVMQLMPDTAWKVLRVNPWNPRQNIQGAARYLARMISRFHGNLREALMAYNAGPTAVREHLASVSSRTYAERVLQLEERV